MLRTRSLVHLLLAILLLACAAPGSSVEAAAPRQADHKMAVFILHPLVKVYEGDTINLAYTVEDLNAYGGITLAPLTPGDATATALLGDASVTPQGLSGGLVYHATKAGQETITLTVSNYFGSASGTIEFIVYPEPNYELDFFLVSEDTTEAGGGFRDLFYGSGQFSNTEDTPVNGSGQADNWFVIWVNNSAFACTMDPVVQGSTTFEIVPSNTPPIAPLIRPAGYIEPISLDLAFQPITTNASQILCSGLGNISVNFPWPAATGDPNEVGLKGLVFPGEGGVIEYSNGSSTHGNIVVTRISE